MKYLKLILRSKSVLPKSPHFFFMVLTFFLIFSCAAPDIAPDVKIGNASEYQSYQIKGDLHVGMQPFQEKQEVKKYFGTDLIDEGIIPILVVAENHSETSSYLFPSEKPEFYAADQQGTATPQKGATGDEAFDADEQKAKSTMSKKLNREGKLRITPFHITRGTELLTIVGWVDLGPSWETRAAHQNMTTKALRNETLSPGEKQSGFIYLSLKKELVQDLPLGISIKALNTRSKQTEDFNLTFVIKKNGG